MKFCVFLFSALLILVQSCTTDNSPSSEANAIVTSNQWKVQSYVDRKNRDLTSLLASSRFSFEQNSKLVIKQNNVVFTEGTWKIILDSGREKMLISIPIQNDDLFEELNEDWEIMSKSESKIVLENASGGNGGKSTLTLVAI